MRRRDLLLAFLAGPPTTELVKVPGGRYLQGSDDAELRARHSGLSPSALARLLAETPQHEVIVAPFWMERCEVTNAAFAEFVEANPEWHPNGKYLSHWKSGKPPAGKEEHPVTFVTWQAAAAYAQWRGRRLPSEAEWELAARGGKTGVEFPWGETKPAPDTCNYAASGVGEPVAVQSYEGNEYGLYDLAGNVWEYCVDEWKAPYNVAYRPAAVPEDWKDATAARVIRGGSYAVGELDLRVTARRSHAPGAPAPDVGFRCAKSA